MSNQLPTRVRAAWARWSLALAWCVLPLSAGAALSDATARWSSSSQMSSEVLAWSGWALGLIGLAIARPWSLTIMRILAPGALVLGLIVLVARGGTADALAACNLAVTAALAWSSGFARAAVDAVSYGTEERFPLQIPPALLFGPVQIAVAVVVGPPVATVMLLADRQWLLGALVVVIGLPAAAFAARSVHGLSNRIVVFVPAGITLVDTFSLSAPVHIPRREIRAIEPLAGPVDDAAADLRIGATRRSVRMALADPTDALPVRVGRTNSENVVTTALLFAPSARTQFLARVAARRVVHTASAPPTSSSPA
ncbi:MAG: hypothetical protein ACOYNI_04915 [Acidimicrobiia bacterium]